MVQLTCAATGDAPLSYQWLFDGLPIPGATGAVLVFLAGLHQPDLVVGAD